MEKCSSQVVTQISEDTIEIIKEVLYSPLKDKEEILKRRFYDEDSRKRPAYQRDYTRILYSSAFRRLQGKMQLMAMNETNFMRNRLTHSLEVAQIARSIANDIGYCCDELYVVEACSLAHDIGNPPFGHYGERVLNKIINTKCETEGCCIEDVEGFEGNAQTLRVLTHLSGKSNDYDGLNLTYRVLLGVTKYFNRYSENRKKFIYESNYNELNKIVFCNELPKRTLDVQIMDLSDEIAYAAHDIEDALKNRMFTIDEFIAEFQNNDDLKAKFDRHDVEEAITFLQKEIIKPAKDKVGKNSVQYNDLFAKEIGSLIIYNLIKQIKVIENGYGEKELGLRGKYKVISDGLKKITFECINRENEVKYYELKGKIILEDLFDYFYKHVEFLPREYRPDLSSSKEQKIRAVIDYISGMMDGYAISVHKQIYGEDRFKVHGFAGVGEQQ